MAQKKALLKSAFDNIVDYVIPITPQVLARKVVSGGMISMRVVTVTLTELLNAPARTGWLVIRSNVIVEPLSLCVPCTPLVFTPADT